MPIVYSPLLLNWTFAPVPGGSKAAVSTPPFVYISLESRLWTPRPCSLQFDWWQHCSTAFSVCCFLNRCHIPYLADSPGSHGSCVEHLLCCLLNTGGHLLGTDNIQKNTFHFLNQCKPSLIWRSGGGDVTIPTSSNQWTFGIHWENAKRFLTGAHA